MARRKREGSRDSTDWSSERTLADAEADARDQAGAAAPVDAGQWSGDETVEGIAAIDSGLPFADTAMTDPGATSVQPKDPARCACGGEEFVLEAYLAVIRGRPQREPLELESLTCPSCGREYEAIWLADGRVARGEFRGQTDVEE